MVLPTHDGRPRVLLPKDTPGIIKRTGEERRRLEAMGCHGNDLLPTPLSGTSDGYEIRSCCPEADAYVLALVGVSKARFAVIEATRAAGHQKVTPADLDASDEQLAEWCRYAMARIVGPEELLRAIKVYATELDVAL